ncbi:MAG: porin family protein [Muribaculaceae bacterium]|nr:porin family protein [Muribaculaceae bacterium]
MNKLLRYIAITALLICTLANSPEAKAQEDYRFDIGGGVGMTGYLGDANGSNLYANPKWDLELLFRYILNPRWNFKTNFYAGALGGDSSKMTNVFPGENYTFSTSFYEIGELAEFHFFEYGMGEYYRKLKRWTPYITAGLSATVWSVDGHTYGGFTIPMGVGFKFKPSRRLNLGLEFLMKKVFSDRLDGENLRDPFMIKSSFAKNTDWYSTLTLTISYEFSKRCAVCNYKD